MDADVVVFLMRCNAQDFIARYDKPKIYLLGIRSLACCSNRKFSITYDLPRAVVSVWVVSWFANLFSKAKRDFADFVQFCAHNSSCLKRG